MDIEVAMEATTITLDVRGMTCGHCASTVERAARNVAGAEDARVDLTSGTLIVRGNASRESVAAAVRAAGYEA